jgi:long-chain acyl-CoA synthetase
MLRSSPPSNFRQEATCLYELLREVWNELTAPGAPFEVSEVTVRGVPVKAYAKAPATLRDLWLGSALHGDKDYLVYEDRRWTYAEAHREVAAVAGLLAAQGVGPGDRVAIAMRNYPEWMLSYWATVSMGATVVGMNAWWTGPEMAYGIQDAEPKVMICDAERLERILPHAAESPGCTLVQVRTGAPPPPGVIDWSQLRLSGESLPEAEIDPDSDACIFYTSGTTGHPKGAQLTHRGCTNNVYSMAFANLCQAAALARAGGEQAPSKSGPPPQAAALITTPLFHVTANNCVAQPMTLAGGKLVHTYKWDAGEALRLIEAERLTMVSGVPVMIRELIAHPDFPKYDTSSLKGLGGGGAQFQPDLVKKIDTQGRGARPNTGYGMTETSGIITAVSADFFVGKPASAGPAMPTYEAKCVDDQGRSVGTNEVGELWVRGAQVIRGYLNRPDASSETITEGWLHTGDVARIDEDGFIFIVDRIKDMVIRGGENVYCAEVESAIFDHEAVAECAVFGVVDARLGEEVGAAVVLRDRSALSSEAIREHCAPRLAKYKIPRYIWLLSDALPRNASGKFLKKQLREELDPADAV